MRYILASVARFTPSVRLCLTPPSSEGGLVAKHSLSSLLSCRAQRSIPFLGAHATGFTCAPNGVSPARNDTKVTRSVAGHPPHPCCHAERSEASPFVPAVMQSAAKHPLSPLLSCRTRRIKKSAARAKPLRRSFYMSIVRTHWISIRRVLSTGVLTGTDIFSTPLSSLALTASASTSPRCTLRLIEDTRRSRWM